MPQLASHLAEVLDAAKLGPRPLAQLRQKAELLHERPFAIGEAEVLQAVASEGEGGDMRRVLGAALARWDHQSDADWADGAPSNTRHRRDRIYELLGFDAAARALLDERVPFFQSEGTTVIQSRSWTAWYAPGPSRRDFYWRAFTNHLRTSSRWPEDSILALDETTTTVVERLSDPTAATTYQSRGLVVGYVQSGKTANITGVAAKAADAGYRLVIVLAGTLDLLRNQTQRRLDKELVGAELLEDEYFHDADWETSLRHGARPSTLGAFDWTRLTTRDTDYSSLRGGAIESLRFTRAHPDLPLHDPNNLHRTNARLIVAKKNAAVLRRLCKDLARADVVRDLPEVPALIIDDESDQASVNTLRPRSSPDEDAERTAVNRTIVELLRALPRAQYVGYTATPFANVFIDPTDAEDLFPRDFLVTLPKPPGYVGVGDLHDLEGVPAEVADKPFASNERAFVRAVYGDEEHEGRLRDAIDAFVLAGAIKLYRQRQDPDLRFRHHTMMVHTSQRVDDHHAEAELVRDLLAGSGYRSGAGLDRLRRLFGDDFRPVSRCRAPTSPLPERFEELEEDLGEVVSLLHHGGDAVLVVNSTGEADQLAFDSEPVWNIIVGGAKLSRGFTIEGLTISYFRRRSPAADTLMQMGRWCGFRKGYADLVRVFIGRAEPKGRDTVDVYEAFEAICRDEESFRQELRRYAKPPDGTMPLTPMQVPPLVQSHLDWVKPTSRNKMYNARIAHRNFGGLRSEHRRLAVDPADIAHNEQLFRQLLVRAGTTPVQLRAGSASITGLASTVDAAAMLHALHEYRWFGRQGDLQQELDFLSGAYGDPEIDDWAVLVPQLKHAIVQRKWRLDGHSCSVHLRRRLTATGGLTGLSLPEDRSIAETIVGLRDVSGCSVDLKDIARRRRGVLLLYALAHTRDVPDNWVPSMGMLLLFPPNNIRQLIAFEVQAAERPDDPVVELFGNASGRS